MIYYYYVVKWIRADAAPVRQNVKDGNGNRIGVKSQYSKITLAQHTGDLFALNVPHCFCVCRYRSILFLCKSCPHRFRSTFAMFIRCRQMTYFTDYTDDRQCLTHISRQFFCRCGCRLAHQQQANSTKNEISAPNSLHFSDEGRQWDGWTDSATQILIISSGDIWQQIHATLPCP